MAGILIFLRGVWTGLFLGILLSMAAIAFGLYWILDTETRLSPISVAQREEGLAKDGNSQESPWPVEVVEFLRKQLTPDLENDHCVVAVNNVVKKTGNGSGTTAQADQEVDYMSPTLDVRWANVLLSRFFLALRQSPVYRTRTCLRMTKKMNAKIKNNTLVVCLALAIFHFSDKSRSARRGFGKSCAACTWPSIT